MQPRNPWCAFVIAVALAVSGSAVAQQPQAPKQHQWATYHNDRFGTTADYPADIFTVRAWTPGNDGGQIFRTADGRAQLKIYGRRNFEEDSPSFYVEKHFNTPEVTYKSTKWPSFIVSGVHNGEIFYDRCNFPIEADGIIDCLELRYPAKDKANWGPIVTRISQSLRSGKSRERRE